jgi:FkbM family methyltransferase
MSEPSSLESFAVEIQKRLDRLQYDVEFIKNHMSSYLGKGTGLTHLIDETPIYINTNDYGCPSNFINGGRYEEEYFAVLASFRKPHSIFLDIGANLGVFSLRMAPLIRKGKIFAFEPNSDIRELFSRSIHLNGIKNLISLFGYGVSDRDEKAALSVPEGHAGGGGISLPVSGAKKILEIEVRRLDGLLPNVGFDIAKIDIEGHELQALRGMMGMLRRSPNAVVLFEKLDKNSGIEPDLLSLFMEVGMSVYRVDGLTLTTVDVAQFAASEAYFVAARPSTIGQESMRNFFTVYPEDLHAISATVQGGRLVVDSASGSGELLFYGPYWFLPRGSYNMLVDGDIEGEFTLTLAEKFGGRIQDFIVSAQSRSVDFIVERDLTNFEIVGRAMKGQVKFSVNNFRFTRRG